MQTPYPYNLSNAIVLILMMAVFFMPSAMASNDDYATEVRYLYVQKGQTLHNIVKRLYPDRQTEWKKIGEDIIRLNPQAFPGGKAHKMVAGVRITLPSRVKVRSAENLVGRVVAISGSVVAVDADKVSRKLSSGRPVFLGDKIITGDDGSVRLKMIDDAVLDLRCYSIMVIEKYAINTGNRSSIINLLQGSLRKITGKIGDLSEDDYELKTPVANIAVRGTEYALRVFQSKGCGGKSNADDGLYIKVIDGIVDLKNDGGNAVIARGETAYVSLPNVKPVKKPVLQGIIEPVAAPVRKPVAAPVQQAAPVADKAEPEDESSVWWWLLGILAVVLLI